MLYFLGSSMQVWNNKIISLAELLVIVQETYQNLYGERRWRCHAQVKQITIKGTRVYLELVELGDNGSIRAQSKWIMRDKQILDQLLKKVWMSSYTALIDKELVVSTSVHFHPVWWFTLYIHEISAEHILGKEQLRMQRLQEALRNEGVRGANKEKLLWDPVWHIAVITAPDSAWWDDYKTIIENSPWQLIHTIIPAIVHGPAAVGSILDAREQVPQNADAILILRGWWAKEGMQWANDEQIVRRACSSPIPVMTALGHTQDMSMLDQVVRHNYATPSDAAHALSTRLRDYETRINASMQQIQMMVRNRFQTTQRTIDNRYQTIQHLAKQHITTYRTHVSLWYEMIRAVWPQKVLEKGYVLLRDPSTNAYMKAQTIASLQPWDLFVIQTKERRLRVTLVSNTPDTLDTPNACDDEIWSNDKVASRE
jgi:exodeoxyribonuclease VII large subunit